VIYLFIVTFVFGAAVASTAALALDAAFPGVLPMWAWAALHSVAAFAVVAIGRYGLFERIMKTFAALKFGIVILQAILLAPSLGEIAIGFVPRIPEGALINVLAIIGSWNGGAHLFADCVRTIREVPDEEASDYLSEKSIYFRAFLVWITFPPMILLAFGQPILLVIVYASLGALFLPFLAITLLVLLNSERVAPEYRNRLVSNVVLAVSVIPFIVVGVQEVLGSL
jgi:hypothetical protein